MDDVKEFLEFLGQEMAVDPEYVLEAATETLPEVAGVGACATAQITMSRGSAFRILGRLEEAEKDFSAALLTCRCRRCEPRLLRRLALLHTQRDRHLDAFDCADEAVRRFADLGDFEMVMRSRATRAAVLYFGGDVRGAIRDAWPVYRYYGEAPSREPLHYGAVVQALAVYLAAAGRWRVAHRVLRTAVLKHCNYRILKLKIRWIAALIDFELGVADRSAAGRRVKRVLCELLGLGLPVRADQASVEAERAGRARKRNVVDLAALTADLALLGGRPLTVARHSREALDLMRDSGGNLRRALVELHSASEQGGDVRALALRVRALCPGAPPAPPSLTKAA